MRGRRTLVGGWLLGILLVSQLIGGGGRAAAETPLLGFINSDRILAEYEPAVEAQQVLARENRGWEERAEELKKEYGNLLEEFESQRLMLSEDRLREREKEVSDSRRAYEDYVMSIWGDDGKAAQRNLELTKPIIDKVNEILQRICEEEGYVLVLDASEGLIVYAQPGLDLTDRILEELQESGE